MKIIRSIEKRLIFLLLMIVAIGCEISYSPFQTLLEGDHTGLTRENINILRSQDSVNGKDFKFAVIGDNHAYLGKLSDVVNDINSRDDIDFIIHAGDMTDYGLMKEYTWVAEIMDRLNKPYFTVIGNHDCLTSGVDIYRKMFGELNYSFEYKDYKFILFNTNVWEASYTGPQDTTWFYNEFAGSEPGNIISISHIAPFAVQFDGHEYEESYKNLLRDADVAISIHGHNHGYYYGQKFNDGIEYLVVDDLKDSNYCTVSIVNDEITVERIFF